MRLSRAFACCLSFLFSSSCLHTLFMSRCCEYFWLKDYNKLSLLFCSLFS
jgi:hypothetical protein